MTSAFEQFNVRLKHFQTILWSDDSNSNIKSSLIYTSRKKSELLSLDDSLFQWLTGYYFNSSLVLITSEKIGIYVSSQKDFDQISEFREANKVFVQVQEVKSDNIQTIVKEFIGDEDIGVSQEFLKNEEQSLVGITDISPLLEKVLIFHQPSELSRIRNAARVAERALQNVFKPLMEKSINDNDLSGVRELSDFTRSDLNNPNKIYPKLNPSDVEACFRPVVSSGYSINTDFPPEQLPGNLSRDIISCSIGIRFKSYVAVVGRTFLINSSSIIKSAYKSLVKARDAAVLSCKIGNSFGEVYETFINSLDEIYRVFAPETIGYFSGVIINTEHHCIVKEIITDGVSIVLTSYLKNVEIENQQAFTLSLIDTIQITDEGPKLLTSSRSKFKSIAYSLDDDNEKSIIDSLINDNRSISERTRGRDSSGKKKIEAEEETVFAELAAQRQTIQGPKEEINSVSDSIQHISYHDQRDIPDIRSTIRIVVHQQRQTVCFPILGSMVPFHIRNISSVKSTTSPDGTLSTLSVRFDLPRVKDEEVKDIYVKELTFNTPGNNKFADISKQISELRNRFNNTQRKHREDREVYVNEELKVVQGRPFPRLSGNIRSRPTLSGKKSIGNLEAHINGFRYRTNHGETLHVMYNNIKLAYFQRSSQESVVLLHFMLRKPIKINGHAESHVTFIRQIVQDIDLLSHPNHMMTDQAEFAEEEHDRRLRKRINKEFSTFCEEVGSKENGFINPPKFEQPHRNLMFSGVVMRQVINIYLLVNCIVSVVESPPHVILVDDIEVVQFERVMLSLKYFDMTIVFRDWSAEAFTITQIPVMYLELIQKWLNTVNIKFYKHKVNLEWKGLLSHLSKMGRKAFEEEGGWDGFLHDEEEEYAESEAFEEDFDEGGEDDEDDEEFDGDEDEEEVNGDEEVEDEDSEEEGKDWRQLDEEAAEHDRKAEMKHSRKSSKYDDDDDEPRRKSSKHSSKDHKKDHKKRH